MRNSRRGIGFVLGLSILYSVSAFAADGDSLAERLKEIDGSHPRLFFAAGETADLKAKLDSDPLLSGARDYLVAGADIVLEQAPVEREQVGKRLLGVSRTALQRISYLAMAYRLTEDERYADRAEQEMMAAAGFSDWNPSHFLDVAEMTAALAIGYDWLYDDLPAESRDTIREAIVEKGLKTSLDGGWWVTTTNNWNQVCHGGLTLGALAVAEDHPDLAETIIARGLKHVPAAQAEYKPDGVYPEGPTYWKYGTTYNVILIDALESVLGSDFELASAKGFMRSPEFYFQAAGPTGMFFNFSDCGLRGGVSPAMHWFANRLERPGLLWQEKEALASFVADEPRESGRNDRMLAFLLLWSEPMGDLPEPTTLHWRGDGPTPVTFHRTGWDADATFFGIKGGSPHTNHAHMDIGSFVLDMLGERWAVDLGAQSYHDLESQGIGIWDRSPGGERWTVFRLNSLSHNTLVVDGELQKVEAHAPITEFSDKRGNAYTKVEMSPVYEGQLASATRGMRLEGDGVLVQDELTALDHTTPVRWGMATRAGVEIDEANSNRALLRQGEKTVTLQVLSPQDAELELYEMENPPNDYDAKNPDTRMIGFEAELGADTKATWAVSIQPGEADAAEAPEVRALAEW